MVRKSLGTPANPRWAQTNFQQCIPLWLNPAERRVDQGKQQIGGFKPPPRLNQFATVEGKGSGW